MEKFEQIKQPEIKKEELLVLIESIKWESGYGFSFNGTDFLLFILNREDIERDVDGLEAEYYASTSIDGWDIYIHDSIPVADRKRYLFHEILEANLRDQEYSMEVAHKIALAEEQKIFKIRVK